MKNTAIAAALCLSLLAAATGCSRNSVSESKRSANFADEKVGVEMMAPPPPPTTAGAPTVTAAASAIAVPQLAYDYRYAFQAPAAGVEALITADQALCDQAGVTACQMISLTGSTDRGDKYVNKTLELRVTAAWLKAYQAGMNAGLAKVHGRIASQAVSSEDLSLQIVNSEAHIKNQEALRDRLTEIIRTSPGKIEDLVAAETQLSQVQEDIDAAQSALAVMQKRVATSHLTLTYVSDAVAASSGTFEPVSDAFKNILRNMMVMFAVIINVLSFLVPLAIIVVPAVWYGLKWRRQRKARAVIPTGETE